MPNVIERKWGYAVLGLPEHVHACLFDLDGVLTDTASVHRKAWKAMFDDFLRRRAERTG
ncbi:MAG: Beta-phosphoglucomutase, partial [Mycobacterium sp.]|nr:Beta-phosphoglucomutase [Mycobacterium sp.]